MWVQKCADHLLSRYILAIQIFSAAATLWGVGILEAARYAADVIMSCFTYNEMQLSYRV